MKWMHRNIVALVVVVALSVGLAGPVAVQAQVQSGLVNVNVGDIEILNNARIGIAAQLAAEICGVTVGPVAVLAVQVARTGQTQTVCETAQGPITISQP
jgi:hypothetical protein